MINALFLFHKTTSISFTKKVKDLPRIKKLLSLLREKNLIMGYLCFLSHLSCMSSSSCISYLSCFSYLSCISYLSIYIYKSLGARKKSTTATKKELQYLIYKLSIESRNLICDINDLLIKLKAGSWADMCKARVTQLICYPLLVLYDIFV